MRAILTEFNNTMSHISNNFYTSFLAINFLNQRPFKENITLAVDMHLKVMDVNSLNTFSKKHAEEYANSIRRHFLNDMVIAYERYSTSMIASHKNGQIRIDPCLIKDRTLKAHKFDQLKGVSVMIKDF